MDDLDGIPLPSQRKSNMSGTRRKRPPKRSAIKIDIDAIDGDIQETAVSYNYISSSDCDRSFESSITKFLDGVLSDFKDDFLHEFSLAVEKCLSFDDRIDIFANELAKEIEQLMQKEGISSSENETCLLDIIKTTTKQFDTLKVPEIEPSNDQKKEAIDYHKISSTNRSFRESITHLMNQFRSERNELSAARDRLNYGFHGGSKRISMMMADVEAVGKQIQIRHDALQKQVKRHEASARAFREKQFKNFGEESDYSGLTVIMRDLKTSIKQSQVQSTFKKTAYFVRNMSDMIDEVMGLSTRIHFGGDSISRTFGMIQSQRKIVEYSFESRDFSMGREAAYTSSPTAVRISESQNRLNEVREKLRQLQEQRAAAQRSVLEFT